MPKPSPAFDANKLTDDAIDTVDEFVQGVTERERRGSMRDSRGGPRKLNVTTTI